MFRLLRYYSVASGLALLAVTLVLVAVYRDLALDQVVEEVEAENVTMSRILANAIWPRFADYVTEHARRDGDELRARPETAEIHAATKRLTAGLNVVKVKIYRLDGFIVYSSNLADIGNDEESQEPAFARAAREGVPASKFGFQPVFDGINGRLTDRHIVESYLPIRGSGGNVEGVFELYSDATARVASVANEVKWLSIGLVWTFGILYGVLFIIVRRADGIIKRQYADLRHEIGERLATERKLQQAVEDAENANRAKSRFLAHMSHELRTPLNSIIGFAETMVHEIFGKLENEKYKEYAADIHDSGTHLVGLINEVLDVSKIEAGAMELHEENIDLAQVMKECADMMKIEADKVGIDLRLSMPNNLPEFNGDGLRLKQIFLNLLSNAIKFTPAGGRITLNAGMDDNGGFKFAVTDTGIGIEAEHQARILQPFEQIEDHPNRSRQGTGLGLALSKSLTELHGGELSLESEPGVGTTVTLRFPPERALVAEPRLPLHHP